MTIIQAFIAEMEDVPVSNTLAGKILSDKGLDASATYSAAVHEQAVDMAVAAALTKALARPSVSEGGYSVRFDAGAIQARIAAIYTKWNVADPGAPTIKAVNPW
ncbi:hypothetical protein SAMN05444008_102376 [Cnuella takakiae]|uniref:Uncharacterized protein n=1 Tax=Cnuella takakiae TaxID=1302690 RepID=A0A1M4VTQ6_9BACT|nr:DUF6706 family protein [Cnuella takakiae]OLY92504.1 hypothetical protein BUE76_11850 [Cnuella takakiae]SHE72240.1 hypothetical protein SAMN05444008_102376 [Cnuella takakiae]